MATLTTRLTLSSNSSATDRLNVTVVDTPEITNPSVNIARQSIATDSAFNVLTTSNSSITYVYLKNLDKTNFITVKDDAGNNFLDLSPGEFTFLPVKGGVGLEVQADTAACILEYGYWTKS